MVLVVIIDLMTEELEDKIPLFIRHHRRVIVDSPINPDLHMPHKIRTTMDESVSHGG